jgi:hypothetical protein
MMTLRNYNTALRVIIAPNTGAQCTTTHEEVEMSEQETGTQENPKVKSAGDSVGKAINSFVDTLEIALAGRGNAVMVRVNDEALEKLDMLVASGICGSRSESAAFLLQRGIEGSADLFARIADITGQITAMRQELQDWVQKGK